MSTRVQWKNTNDEDTPRLHRPLACCAAAMALLAVVATCGLFLDGRTVLGEGVWLKPLKFAVSFGLYTITLAWMVGRTERWQRTLRRIGTVTVVLFIVPEISIITFQAARGERSHFNVSSTLNDVLVKAMGGAAYVGWATTLLLGVFLLWQRKVDRPLAWAIPIGLFVSLAGMSIGYLMTTPTAAQQRALDGGGNPPTLGAHSVGQLDGGSGMPLTSWSTGGGDLRVAHFVGLHALQLLPLAAVGLGMLAGRLPLLRGEGTRTALVVIGGAGHAGLTALLLWQAERGQPLFEPDRLTLSVAAGLVGAVAVAVAVVLATASRDRRGSPGV
ncbi:hypothetical protein OG978_43040 (plasmid) [Streptomyces sp. NBC_01591]|uniref:hypothetical protein n=1 Tax=Streptomyces sp. NBC_01591 TaxID=2975888 RepID=UPI002DD94215|nr:hypothetical protein [Streptomyces sp. NBC_01591]WSD73958.1 hypothetical protein OG978_43040 [Streptomyces sp. NBC_01591]